MSSCTRRLVRETRALQSITNEKAGVPPTGGHTDPVETALTSSRGRVSTISVHAAGAGSEARRLSGGGCVSGKAGSSATDASQAGRQAHPGLVAHDTPGAEKRARADDAEEEEEIATVEDSLLSLTSPSMMKKPRVHSESLESPLTGWTEVTTISPITPGLGNSMSSMSLNVPRRTPEGEYAHFVVHNWLNVEETKPPVRPDYLDWQEDLSRHSRADSVGFIIDMGYRLSLQCETVHLAVLILDSTLTKFKLVRSRLKQVLLAALRVAAKYEELVPPCLQDYARVIRTPVDREQMTGMEMVILNALNYDITFPSSLVFAMGWMAHCGLEKDVKLRCMIMFLLECCLVDYRMLNHRHSEIAASAIAASWILVGYPGGAFLKWHWDYTVESIAPITAHLWENVSAVCEDSQTYAGRTVQKKYANDGLMRVSMIARAALRNGAVPP